jgi:hypothetical protein
MTKRPETPSSSAGRAALVVAGMHRSGTSAMARVLGLAGAGMPERVIKAASDNPLGFWEPRDVVALNDEILRTVGSSWNDVFGTRVAALSEPLWRDFLPRARAVIALNYAQGDLAVMKDPRVSLLTPLWSAALAEEGFDSRFVIMVRDPIEVAQSIAARDQATVQASVLAWLSHMISVERDTRGSKRVFVRYTDLIEDWQAVLDRIRTSLSVDLPVTPEVAGEISGFLSRSARHHATDEAQWVDRADLWPGVAEAWRWLTDAAQGRGPTTDFPSSISADLERLGAQLGPVLTFEKDQATRRERDLQAVLADRERSLLRLKAQAAERKTADDAQVEQLVRMQHDLTVAQEALADGERREAIAAETADSLNAELAQSKARLAEATTRISTLNDRARAVEAELLDRNEALARALETIEETSRALDAARSDSATLREQRDVVTSRVDAMIASRSWKLTKPVRVVQKRLRKPSKHA